MHYYKTKNGVTTVVQKGTPMPDKREDTAAYRDPVDVVSGTITKAQCYTIVLCKKENQEK